MKSREDFLNKLFDVSAAVRAAETRLTYVESGEEKLDTIEKDFNESISRIMIPKNASTNH